MEVCTAILLASDHITTLVVRVLLQSTARHGLLKHLGIILLAMSDVHFMAIATPVLLHLLRLLHIIVIYLTLILFIIFLVVLILIAQIKRILFLGLIAAIDLVLGVFVIEAVLLVSVYIALHLHLYISSSAVIKFFVFLKS